MAKKTELAKMANVAKQAKIAKKEQKCHTGQIASNCSNGLKAIETKMAKKTKRPKIPNGKDTQKGQQVENG